ncbi:hypothetical protein FYM84_23955 [Pseudomonas sp. CAH-1]|nr:hypothetical protein [Pseudomonas sp. CAH-1]
MKSRLALSLRAALRPSRARSRSSEGIHRCGLQQRSWARLAARSGNGVLFPREQYGTEVSRNFISSVIDAVMEEVGAWQATAAGAHVSW